jgi:hypothetical protein
MFDKFRGRRSPAVHHPRPPCTEHSGKTLRRTWIWASRVRRFGERGPRVGRVRDFAGMSGAFGVADRPQDWLTTLAAQQRRN